LEKFTEKDSHYRHLEKMSTSDLIKSINTEDKSVPLAIEKELKDIERLVDAVYDSEL